MIYISLLVHENPEVIINQLENINKFYDKCEIIMHLSKSSEINDDYMEKLIKFHGINNVIINPERQNTSWGNVILGHISNINLIKNTGGQGIIVFHASNDMLISRGVQDYVTTKKNAFNKRLLMPGGYWWPAHAVFQDKVFVDFINSFGSGAIFGSQIEGSFYETNILFEIVNLIEKNNLLQSSLHYTREEIFFSTIANALGYEPEGFPYVYSEVHCFDRILWKKFEAIDRITFIPQNTKNKIKDYLNKKIFEDGDYRVTTDNIDLILNKNINFLRKNQYLDDGNNIWKIYDVENIYAVKRVNRDMSDPVRKVISAIQ
ncbi:hypothetical protein JK165_03135 [Acetobacter okinawensis]|uniref:hypothetical protein n=1 Tax=Acetobacter okinawensis TaxID=1076594 RepID=UPI001BA7DCF4|nr:hypothetical protein [Acetobacter okinawensis]MBS0965099.1 hypothetical protein [Acetobacter okinawensis]